MAEDNIAQHFYKGGVRLHLLDINLLFFELESGFWTDAKVCQLGSRAMSCDFPQCRGTLTSTNRQGGSDYICGILRVFKKIFGKAPMADNIAQQFDKGEVTIFWDFLGFLKTLRLGHRKTRQCLQRGQSFGKMEKKSVEKQELEKMKQELEKMLKQKLEEMLKQKLEKMKHTSSKYDLIRELDEERRRNIGPKVSEMSIKNYKIPPPFWELGSSIKDEEICPTRLANSSNRIRVKNIRTGVLFEFTAMVNAARFLGATRANMNYGIVDEVAKVYRVGEKEYVFEYDGVERPMVRSSSQRMSNGLIEVVSSTGRRRRFDSYLSVARQLGLLVGHVIEEEKRWKNNQFAKRYVTGKEVYTIEFKGEERDKDRSNGIVCHWKGIYDEDGDWEKIRRIKVTYGKYDKKR